MAATAFYYQEREVTWTPDRVNIEGWKLIKGYERDPLPLISYQVEVDPISKIITLVVLLCDGYFQLKSHHHHQPFFHIMSQLPMEMQMIICNTMFKLLKQNVIGKLVIEQAKIILKE